MNEHYFVRNGCMQDRSCKWVSQDPDKFDWGNNYLIHRISENYSGFYPGVKILNLDDIDAQGNGRGTVFLASVVNDYILLGANSLFGQFQPRGVRERIRTWYENRGIDVNLDSELFGQLSVIYARCMNILSRNMTTFEVI